MELYLHSLTGLHDMFLKHRCDFIFTLNLLDDENEVGDNIKIDLSKIDPDNGK
jgi:hypothetical protein